MKCYKIAFSKNIIFNYGFYILDIIIILFIICLILFSSKYYFILISEIKEMISLLKNHENKLENNAEIGKNDVVKTKKIVKVKKIKKAKKRTCQKKNNKNKNLKNEIKNENKMISLDHSKSINKLFERHLDKKETAIPNNNDNIINYTDSELNSLNYEEAIKNDKRTYTQYYISLLKTKHLVLFSFYPNKDYNSRIIKIFLFFFFFSTHFTLNALFYNDSTMHKIYEDEGIFNFVYQIPQIIYSSIISIAVSFLIKNLSLSEKYVLEIKREKNINKFDALQALIKKLKIKFVMFFIITFIILSLFWYYITCFCGVYKNTQVHLIKDSFSSFFLSLIYPFGIYLIPGVFRICSLENKKKNKKLMYKFSKLLQYI